jgi:EAL domain-containing protein (putative c-di-GMP-specific phosphodiesterase class I)/GGDEF domain-containing protein
MRLRNQLFWIIAGLFVAVLLAILLVSTAGTRSYLEQQLASHAQDAATALSVTLSQPLGKGDTVLAQTQIASFFDRGYFQSIAVLDTERKPLVSRNLPEKIEGVPLWFAKAVHIDAPVGEAFISSGWRQLGKVLVRSQPTFAYQHLWQTSWQLLLWLLGICTAALLTLRGGLHLILKPLQAIEKTAEDVQVKRFTQIDLVPSAPELASVVRAMNQMSSRVGEMLDLETARALALQREAYEDEATGFANRRGYLLRLTELLKGEFHFDLGGVVSVELDDMRLMKRSHGFAAGLEVMRVVAESARSVMSAVPVTLMAHNNEFNFSFVMADVTEEQARALAKALRERILSALTENESAQHIGIQTGLAFFNQKDECSDVLSRTDLAVETARQSERNGFAVLAAQAPERCSLGSFGWRTLISTALVEKRWRLLHQPVMKLDANKKVIQVECMARLVDQHGMLVPAANFLPMAARHQLMPEIDRAMLSLAFDSLRESVADTAVVAVNVSPQSIADSAFMIWLEFELAALGANARRLAIEISEFGALRNEKATQGLRDLARRFGGQFGIDRFGLDPKALSLLRSLVPDYVKLTGALMSDLGAANAATDMLASFATLAHSLDVQVIAQQVETAQQVDVLEQAKVDAGQGYYFGAPQ